MTSTSTPTSARPASVIPACAVVTTTSSAPPSMPRSRPSRISSARVSESSSPTSMTRSSPASWRAGPGFVKGCAPARRTLTTLAPVSSRSRSWPMLRPAPPLTDGRRTSRLPAPQACEWSSMWIASSRVAAAGTSELVMRPMVDSTSSWNFRRLRPGRRFRCPRRCRRRRGRRGCCRRRGRPR